MKEDLKKIIIYKHNISNGSNGFYLVDLRNLLDCGLIELNNCLNELYTEKFIIIRKGINGTLIFKK